MSVHRINSYWYLSVLVNAERPRWQADCLQWIGNTLQRWGNMTQDSTFGVEKTSKSHSGYVCVQALCIASAIKINNLIFIIWSTLPH